MIPKKIWQTYKVPYDELPEYAKEASSTWISLNRGWGYKYYSDIEAGKFVKKEYGDEWYDIWSNVRVGVMKADLWRYMIVYRYGGMYSDLDTICKIPIDSWLPKFGSKCKFIVCVENEIHMEQWTFIGVAGHPFLEYLLNKIKERFKNAQSYYDNNPHFVHALTANGIFTEAYLEFIGVKSNNLIKDILKLNNSPKAVEYGIMCAPSFRFFHWEVVKHLYGSQNWGRDGKYIRWIEDSSRKPK
jgi:alpha 1,6-mannosyltransferase